MFFKPIQTPTRNLSFMNTHKYGNTSYCWGLLGGTKSYCWSQGWGWRSRNWNGGWDSSYFTNPYELSH
jgi:hypothetical protein